MSEFKITGPGRYLTRNGVMAIVEKKIEDAINWPWIGRSKEYFHAWSDSGLIYSEYSPNDYDIIGPWVEHESGPLGSLYKSYEIARQNGTGKPATGTGAPPNPPSGGSVGQKPDASPDPNQIYPVKLRDWFAGQVISGEMACQSTRFREWNESNVKDLAEWAYDVADAMMAARQKGGAV